MSVTEQHEKSCTVSDAGWSSLVARRAHNPKVVGSNPAPATNFTYSEGVFPSGVYLKESKFRHISPIKFCRVHLTGLPTGQLNHVLLVGPLVSQFHL